MKKLLAFLIVLFAPAIAFADDCVVASNVGPVKGHTGVLVNCIPNSGYSFFQYINQVLGDNSAVIITAIIVLVVFNAIQYMLALGTPGEQTKAKERIVGIVVGIVFLTLIKFVLSILASGLI